MCHTCCDFSMLNLAAGVNLNSKTRKGTNALHFAAQNGG